MHSENTRERVNRKKENRGIIQVPLKCNKKAHNSMHQMAQLDGVGAGGCCCCCGVVSAGFDAGLPVDGPGAAGRVTREACWGFSGCDCPVTCGRHLARILPAAGRDSSSISMIRMTQCIQCAFERNLQVR